MRLSKLKKVIETIYEKKGEIECCEFDLEEFKKGVAIDKSRVPYNIYMKLHQKNQCEYKEILENHIVEKQREIKQLLNKYNIKD